jgi:hypothetical protein
MATQPILDIFVIWHPRDSAAGGQFQAIQEHFHSPSYSGLAGGAVEVYARSVGWRSENDAPRPLEFEDGEDEAVPAAQFKVIIPIVDTEMIRHVAQPDDPWHAYFTNVSEMSGSLDVAIFPLVTPEVEFNGTVLADLIGSHQAIDSRSYSAPRILGREIAQATAQHILSPSGEPRRLKVFISHTKQESDVERASSSRPSEIVKRVRERIGETHLDNFFDANAIQVGSTWEQVLIDEAGACALLMVRTDLYASRVWTQREVRAAKENSVPAVSLYALRGGEERGSFLMDHIPTVTCAIDRPDTGIDQALDRLVDESLKYVLWNAQTAYLSADGFDWLPGHSPEPVTLVPWLAKHKDEQPEDGHLWIIHPDPPLMPPEKEILTQLAELSGYAGEVDVLTPRTFAQRGGKLPHA